MQFAAPGVTFPHAEITHVLPPCDPGSFDEPPAAGGPTCGQIDVTVTTGPGRGQKTSVQVSGSMSSAGLANGDSVQLMRLPQSKGVPAPAMYSFSGSTGPGP